ncbi:MAG: hypothetical protein ACYDA6_01950 [Solirubrobacteraceae bacterium]
MSHWMTARRSARAGHSSGLWWALALLAAGALAQTFTVAVGAATPIAQPFRTPSGQMGCYYTTGPTFLRCDTTYRTHGWTLSRRHQILF